jgi:hypothetical protein
VLRAVPDDATADGPGQPQAPGAGLSSQPGNPVTAAGPLPPAGPVPAFGPPFGLPATLDRSLQVADALPVFLPALLHRWADAAPLAHSPRSGEAADEVTADRPEPSASPEESVVSDSAVQVGGLVLGPWAVDLAALEKAADEFFARLEGLAEDMAATGLPRLAPWLLAAALLAGAVALGRRRRTPSQGEESGGGVPTWAPFPVLAVLPTEEES